MPASLNGGPLCVWHPHIIWGKKRNLINNFHMERECFWHNHTGGYHCILSQYTVYSHIFFNSAMYSEKHKFCQNDHHPDILSGENNSTQLLLVMAWNHIILYRDLGPTPKCRIFNVPLFLVLCTWTSLSSSDYRFSIVEKFNISVLIWMYILLRMYILFRILSLAYLFCPLERNPSLV